MTQYIVDLAGYGVMAFAFFASIATESSFARELFGAEKTNLCTQKNCRAFAPPEEIARISRGVYAEFVGLFVNDGTARWLGLNVENAELVEVSRFAGRRLGSAPKMDAPTIDTYTRETKTDQAHWIDVIRKKSVGQDELSAFVVAANRLWVAKPTFPPPHVTDVHNAMYLVDRESIKRFGGMGDLVGEADELRKLLRSLRDPAWGN